MSMLVTILFILLCGVAFPIGGCAMQRSWSNQLGDVYSVGLGSAACLGGAIAACFSFSIYVGSLVACVASALIAYPVCKHVKTTNFVTFGMIFGSVIGAFGTIVANNATPEALQEYYRWSSSSYFDIESWKALLPAVVVPLSIWRLLRSKSKTETFIITSLMISTLLPVVGFVGMISLVAPNIARIIAPKASFSRECLYASVVGVSLLLVTNAVIWFNPFGIYLPASATMSLIALPLLLVTLKK